MNKTVILIFVPHYLPGYKAGGPIRTIVNLVEYLGDEFQFKVITKDRDFGDSKPYPSIAAEKWQKVGKAKVFYIDQRKLSYKKIQNIINTEEHEILYLNSLFYPAFTIKPLLYRKFNKKYTKPTIVAPRGELSEGALKIKSAKKKLFLYLVKVFNIYENLIWHASSSYEKKDIECNFGHKQNIVIALNTPTKNSTQLDQSNRKKKNKDLLKIIYLSRISVKKNLKWAIETLKKVSGNTVFHIYGPIEDIDYWEECKELTAKVPANVQVEYIGPKKYEDVQNVMMQYDLFFLPTLGENFGHVILEAFSAGCPVLISDQTPWRNLRNIHAGWDIPLSEQETFINIIEMCTKMDDEQFSKWRKGALNYATSILNNADILEDNRNLFYSALKGKVE